MTINLEKQVTLTFSLKYLSNFAKSAPLAREVSLHMSNDVPLLVQFDFEQGTLQFFLAPKVRPTPVVHREGKQADSLVRFRTSKLGETKDGQICVLSFRMFGLMGLCYASLRASNQNYV